MILVTGGTAQGKRAFVERELTAGEAVEWVDGAQADMDRLLSAAFCYNFQAFVRRALTGEVEADTGGLAQILLQARPDRVIVTDEIGGGIVPVDRLERSWREETGRLCCSLAAGARQVWRVNCGLGQRIK
ncbi:MAG: bifunctional adenosylcobinamide kinase/adenosylcobinamide-phosphate guanylyltransferase [Enterocloster asparagiformis]|nr:bifunctional adenosylcobinamide kinase/adenosylcobinamide-phosphate guanylyltransferase [Enterocloster asparagiformis]